MKTLMSPMIKWWYKHKMLMLHNLLLKWSIEEIHLLQDHPQDLIIGSPTKGVMTQSQKLTSFIAHHSFVSCYEPTKVEEALKDPDWINAMHEELTTSLAMKFGLLKSDQKEQESLEQSGCSETSKMIKVLL